MVYIVSLIVSLPSLAPSMSLSAATVMKYVVNALNIVPLASVPTSFPIAILVFVVLTDRVTV